MKLDTSSYYPKSPLDNEPELSRDLDKVEETVSEEVAEEFADTPDTAAPEPPATVEDLPSRGEEFVTTVANFLSWALVPLLMPVYGILLAFNLSILAYISYGTRLAFTSIVAGINVVVPMLLIILLKKAGVVHDVGLNDRKERFIPYLVSIVCLVGTAIFMHFKSAPEWLVMFFFGGALAGLIELIVNNWWKISVHAAGIAGIVALLTYMLIHAEYAAASTEMWLLIVIGLSGLLGAARIWLGRHTLGQVLAGYAVGFTAVYLIMLFCNWPVPQHIY